jgi:hypothetical protein
MRHISLTVFVCLSVAGFAEVYRRITGIIVNAILEGLSRI